jgi:hypothetical protein
VSQSILVTLGLGFGRRYSLVRHSRSFPCRTPVQKTHCYHKQNHAAETLHGDSPFPQLLGFKRHHGTDVPMYVRCQLLMR